ncbi:hypothetical protein PSQ19_13465 [Devosia algicola]|uniref:Uncharacterized protein n=1 Tax=Devosia algicola TaxID=3026418 RepID=A0ABY7YKF8_9HYPH|nr:hypothetical protein [Devosia algicola]WDR01741.1 hypothetical protein PSQ19_13465 [Devosia algicola]
MPLTLASLKLLHRSFESLYGRTRAKLPEHRTPTTRMAPAIAANR